MFSAPAFRSLFLSLFGLVVVIAGGPARAVDLFAFHDAARHVLVFAVPGTELIPATVDQTAATQAALDWARCFYRLKDLAVMGVF